MATGRISAAAVASATAAPIRLRGASCAARQTQRSRSGDQSEEERVLPAQQIGRSEGDAQAQAEPRRGTPREGEQRVQAGQHAQGDQREDAELVMHEGEQTQHRAAGDRRERGEPEAAQQGEGEGAVAHQRREQDEVAREHGRGAQPLERRPQQPFEQHRLGEGVRLARREEDRSVPEVLEARRGAVGRPPQGPGGDEGHRRRADRSPASGWCRAPAPAARSRRARARRRAAAPRPRS